MTTLISWSWITMNLLRKTTEEKKKNRYSEEELDWHTMWKYYILTLFFKNISYQKIYTFSYSLANDKVPSTSS